MARVCPDCGSSLLVKSGMAIKDRRKIQRYRCKKCLWQGYKVHWTGHKKETVEDNSDEVKDI